MARITHIFLCLVTCAILMGASKQIGKPIVVSVGPAVKISDGSVKTDIGEGEVASALTLYKETSAGVTATTLSVPNGGANNWTHKARGIYELEISASQNDTIGTIWVEGSYTGYFPLESPRYSVRGLVRSGTAAGGSHYTVVLDSGASSTDDEYNGYYIVDTTVMQVALITDYTGSSKTAYVTPDLAVASAIGHTFQILTDPPQQQAPAVDSNGRVFLSSGSSGGQILLTDGKVVLQEDVRTSLEGELGYVRTLNADRYDQVKEGEQGDIVAAVRSGLALGTDFEGERSILSAFYSGWQSDRYDQIKEGEQESLLARIDEVLSSSHGAGNWVSASGPGTISHTYTITSTVDGTPVSGVFVEVYTDQTMTNRVASGTTNTFGVVVFYLDAGTYYFKRTKGDWAFENPDTEIVQ